MPISGSLRRCRLLLYAARGWLLRLQVQRRLQGGHWELQALLHAARGQLLRRQRPAAAPPEACSSAVSPALPTGLPTTWPGRFGTDVGEDA